jgi:nucleotide-binding universal stress UspA family protein
MFSTILHANDGSSPAFKALETALALANQNHSTLHMVSVMEIDYLPEFAEEIRDETDRATRRFQGMLQRARTLGEASSVAIHPYVLSGHPVRDVARLATELKADVLIIGATGHSALYERMIGSRADRMVQLAPCPVLVVK